MTVAIIIARGGSRRLPRKNVLPFCGHPVIAWSIVQAKTSALVDRVIMCTDDDEIEEISRSYGAEVIRHPVWPENAHRTFRWALDKAGIADGELVSILPTSPIRRPGDIDLAITERRRLDVPVIGPSFILRENCARRIIGKNQCRTIMISKNSEHVTSAMGFGVWLVKYFRLHSGWDDDMSIDEYEKTLVDDLAPCEGWWYEVPLWTQFEVDTVEEFELCQVLMEHYILKGRKMEEVYK